MYFCVLLCGNVSWLQLDHPFPYYWYDTQDSFIFPGISLAFLFIFLCLSLTYLLLCFLSNLLPGVIDPRLMTMVVLRVACPPATPPNRHAPRHRCSSGFPGHPGRHASLRGPHSYCVRRVVDGCACGNVNIYNDFIVMFWVFCHGTGLYREKICDFVTDNEWRYQATKNNDETQRMVTEQLTC
jgi:hypothetical protein